MSTPFGVAIFAGRYTSENVSQAQPLQIFPNVPCPLLIRLVTGYLFQPLNDTAVILPNGNGSNATQTPMAVNVSMRGEYGAASKSGAFSSSSPQPFSSGVYTVVGGDEWGTLVFLHLTVDESGHLSDVQG